jgi:hypothetical protein
MGRGVHLALLLLLGLVEETLSWLLRLVGLTNMIYCYRFSALCRSLGLRVVGLEVVLLVLVKILIEKLMVK